MILLILLYIYIVRVYLCTLQKISVFERIRKFWLNLSEFFEFVGNQTEIFFSAIK